MKPEDVCGHQHKPYAETYRIVRRDMKLEQVPQRDWVYGRIQWIVFLGNDCVEMFSRKREAIDWILKQEAK